MSTILLTLAKRLHGDFTESGAAALDRQSTLELLQVVHELAAQVERLNLHEKKEE